MSGIGIVGAGVGGLQLALFLQKNGLVSTIYTDRSPEQIRASRLFNLVVRFDPTRERERDLGVEHWDFKDFGVFGVQMYIGTQPPLVWKGSVRRPASGVDMRIYQSTLLEDFAARGGSVVVGSLEADDIARLSDQHDLMVVASGRGSLADMFPRDPERSPYSKPQRLLTGAFCRGLKLPDPLRVIYTISPGNGEIFQAPFTTFEGRVSSLLVEAIPGQAFESISRMRYEDNPKEFERLLVELLREHAPPIYEHVDQGEFGVTRPLDVIQGAVTPVVRRGYVSLGNGKFAIALGDIHVVHDPIIAQGANAASRCGRLLGEMLLEGRSLDESFCADAEQRLWKSEKAATEWTNATLQPPPPHVLQLFGAAAQNRAIADELVDNFGAPDLNWQVFGSKEGAQSFLAKHA